MSDLIEEHEIHVRQAHDAVASWHVEADPQKARVARRRAFETLHQIGRGEIPSRLIREVVESEWRELAQYPAGSGSADSWTRDIVPGLRLQDHAIDRRDPTPKGVYALWRSGVLTRVVVQVTSCETSGHAADCFAGKVLGRFDASTRPSDVVAIFGPPTRLSRRFNGPEDSTPDRLEYRMGTDVVAFQFQRASDGRLGSVSVARVVEPLDHPWHDGRACAGY